FEFDSDFSDANDVADEVVDEHAHEEEGKEMGGTLASDFPALPNIFLSGWKAGYTST
ncbi:hypothetical protein KI387_031827, partial [Taxus chinensis]